jgi:hypothetical protein
MGLFIGQSAAFFAYMTGLANDADAACPRLLAKRETSVLKLIAAM